MVLRPNYRAQVSLFLLLFIFATLSPTTTAQTQPTEARLKEFYEYAEKAGRDWKVPGFSIAIVKDDKVLFAGGFGVRELGKTAKVVQRGSP